MFLVQESSQMAMDCQSESVVVVAFDRELCGLSGGETIRMFIEGPPLAYSKELQVSQMRKRGGIVRIERNGPFQEVLRPGQRVRIPDIQLVQSLQCEVVSGYRVPVLV